jgi:hypothetical protein
MAVDPPLQSAGPVVSVDPNLMMVTPPPMPRNPAPVSSASPVAGPVGVIRAIADVDADTDRIGGRGKAAHAK